MVESIRLFKGLGLLIAMVAALLVGCDSSEPETTTERPEPAIPDPTAGAEKITIAVIPKGTTHEFWKSVHAGAMKATEDHDIEVIWKGPEKEDDRESQIKVVEDFIARDVDGIVLAPTDDMALAQVVTEATRTGIPVVIIDSDLFGTDHVAFVATDNYQGGYKAGKHLGDLLDGEGNVVMLRYQEGSASTANREKGFLAAMETFPNIQIVSENQYGGATTETAMQASENLLGRFREDDQLTIDGIFTPNESTTFGMLRALQDAGFAGDVKFVGFDASEKLVEALEANEIDGLVVQDPVRMGYLGVDTLVKHINGNPNISPRVDTGSTLITPDNLKEEAIQDLINPPLDKYLGE